MVKVVLERTIKGKYVGEIVRLLRQLRVLAMQQPGYISGETLHALDDPNYYLVISTWETLDHWQAWYNNPERKKFQAEIDGYLEFQGKTRWPFPLSASGFEPPVAGNHALSAVEGRVALAAWCRVAAPCPPRTVLAERFRDSLGPPPVRLPWRPQPAPAGA